MVKEETWPRTIGEREQRKRRITLRGSPKTPRGMETGTRVMLRINPEGEGIAGGVKENVQDEFKEALQD